MGGTLIGLASPLAAARLSVEILTVRGLPSPGAPQFTWCSVSASCVMVGTGTTTGSIAVVYEVTEVRGHEVSSTFAKMPSNYAASASGADAYISSLACVSSSSCLLVGNYNVAGDNFGVFTWQMKSGAWNTVSQLTGFPNQYTPQVEQERAACWGPGDCFITGEYSGSLDGAQNWQGFSDVESNGSFGSITLLPIPSTPGAVGDAEFDALSCSLTDPSWCESLSSYTVNNERELFGTTFVDGVETATATVAAPSNYDETTQPIFASTLSCWTESSCIAAGTYQTTDATLHEWRAVLSPSGWSGAEQEPIPATYAESDGAQGYFPPMSACARNGVCVLSGSVSPSAQPTREVPLLVSFVHGGFTAPLAPDPPAGLDFSAFACGAGTCSLFGDESALHSERNVAVITESSTGDFSKATLLRLYPTDLAKRNAEPSITSAWCDLDNVCSASAFYVTSKGKDGIYLLNGLG